jgi:MoaA/NifB/PqqE/SkfB family radical SAM enzyme
MKSDKLERLHEWSRGSSPPPLRLDISPTDKCNLKCRACWQRGFEHVDSSYELPDEKILDVVRQAIGMGVTEFEITGGGEPLMRKPLVIEIMRLVKAAGRYGNITTNGMLFSEEDIETIVGICWDRITFSLDGPDAETNDYLRGKGSFERIMWCIEKLNELKKSRNLKAPALKFNTVLSGKNYGRAKDMIELAGRMECDIVSFEPLTVHSELGRAIKMTPEEVNILAGTAQDAQKMADGLHVLTNIGGIAHTEFLEKSNEMVDVIKKERRVGGSDSHGMASSLCFEPWWHFVVKVDGSAQPCCLYDLKEENVKDKPLAEIWRGKTFQKIREDTVKGRFSKFCSICNAGQVMENREIGKRLSESD